MPHSCKDVNTQVRRLIALTLGGQIRAMGRPACPKQRPARYGESMPAAGRAAGDRPVVVSRIYTRTGDGGPTALGDGSRVGKGDPRLAAYADVDEANCAIGTALALGQLDAGIVTLLTRIQNELFDVGADLCNPITSNPEYPPLRVDDSYVSHLERACDEHNEGLPTLRSFVLPAATPGPPLLHPPPTLRPHPNRTPPRSPAGAAGAPPAGAPPGRARPAGVRRSSTASGVSRTPTVSSQRSSSAP